MSSICPSVAQDIMSISGTGHNVLLSRAKCPLYVLSIYSAGHMKDKMSYICPLHIDNKCCLCSRDIYGTYTGHIRDIYAIRGHFVLYMSYICPI